MAYQLGTEPRLLDDWLHHENDAELYRRVGVMISGAGVCDTGLVLGLQTNGKWAPYNPTVTTGAQTARGVLIRKVDATSAEASIVVLMGKAAIKPAYLAWSAAVDTAAKKATALAALEAHDFVMRGVA